MMTTLSSRNTTANAAAIGWLCLAAIVLVGRFSGAMWTDSVDLAHHYALVVRLAEHFPSDFALDPSLGEMNVYPRGAHLLAALAAIAVGSPILGLNLVTLLAVMTGWGSVAWLVCGDLQAKPRLVVAASLAALLSMNQHWLHLELFGHEILTNFFFAQLLAQSLTLSFLAVLFQLERHALDERWRLALFLPAIYIATSIHALPALQLIGAMAIIAALDRYLDWKRGRKLDRARLAVSLILILAGMALLLGHPAFAIMRQISAHAGKLPDGPLHRLPELLALCVGLALTSAGMLWHWSSRQALDHGAKPLALKYLGAFGLSAAAMCLAQGAALAIGYGSEYAVMKHLFAINTVALAQLALLPALLIKGSTGDAGKPSLAFVLPALPALLLVCAADTVLPSAKVIDTADLRRLERAMIHWRDRLPSADATKFAYATAVHGMTPQLAYMLSIGILHAPRSANAEDILGNRPLSDWPAIDLLVTSEDSAFGKLRACWRAPAAMGLAAVDGACFARQTGTMQARIGFTTRREAYHCSMKGFSLSEASGTWTDGNDAVLVCPTLSKSDKPPQHAYLNASAFLERVKQQRAIFTVAGHAPFELQFDAAHNNRLVELPLAAPPGDQIEIKIHLPDATSPQQVGISGDTRKLGLFVQSIEYR